MSTQSEGQLQTRVRRKFYLDSVALMRHSRLLAGLDGIDEAAMMMATPANQAIMSAAALLEPAGIAADGGDLIISIRGRDAASVQAAHQRADQLLEQRQAAGKQQRYRPRSIRGAIEIMPKANLALISVPGEFAISEARKAIRRGLHAMIFSDNVALEAEAELKREARQLGRLVMGPDCGTAIINGVPLAFANRMRSGDIAIVGASGTGIQEVCSLLDLAGKGISHAIGVGGRDLHKSVGGVSTLMALAALENDQRSRHIVLISKPPDASVAAAVLAAIEQSNKTFTLCFVGGDGAYCLPDNATMVASLKAAAEHAAACRLPVKECDIASLPSLSAAQQRIVGLYSGGTLCSEAQQLLSAQQATVASNVPIPGAHSLDSATALHQLIDLGADQYTRGRPHPMIEPSVRDDILLATLDQPDVAAVILDVVIGYGSHADPAAHLHDLLQQKASAAGKLIIASVTGTEADPQVRSLQIARLQAAGVLVLNCNADAVMLASQYLTQRRAPSS